MICHRIVRPFSFHMSAELEAALSDLAEAIRGITLGSIEGVVLHESGISLIQNWNDHHDDKINEAEELVTWETRFSAS
jgi:hypothetical protein